MSNKFLLTAFSEDRPGIVASISELIYENGCHLEDSAMANLSGEFAILLLFSSRRGENEVSLQEKLSTACRRLERDQGITAYIRPLTVDRPKRKTDTLTKTIHVEGLDQAGIVFKVSRFLAANQINIGHLNSEVRSSPQSGAALYTMKIRAEIPKSFALQDLEDGLNQIGDELNVDVTIE